MFLVTKDKVCMSDVFLVTKDKVCMSDIFLVTKDKVCMSVPSEAACLWNWGIEQGRYSLSLQGNTFAHLQT